MIREHFATQLATRQPEAFRAAHRHLNEHLAAAAPERPDTLDAMLPLYHLYHVVKHGCRAGDVQEIYDDINWERITRRGDHFSTKQIGAFGSDLGALAAFFDEPWRRPSAKLSAAAQALLLNQAAFNLRALSRLTEAVEPMQAAVDNYLEQEAWKNAAISASNLSELTLTLGRVVGTLHAAAHSIELADRSGDAFMRMVSRTKLAHALCQAGHRATSRAAFAQAERALAEVELIAARGAMLSFQVDAAIERTRLALLQVEPEAAAQHLARARALVKQTEAPFVPYVSQWDEWEPPDSVFAIPAGQVVGYHDRNGEIEALALTIAAALHPPE